MANDDDAPSEFVALLRSHLGDPDDNNVRPLARRMAEVGPASSRSYRRMLHRWLAGDNEPSKPNVLVFTEAEKLDPAPFLQALRRRPRGVGPTSPAREEELRGLRADIEDLRAQVEGLAAEVQRLRRARTPRPGGKPRAPSTLERPGGDV